MSAAQAARRDLDIEAVGAGVVEGHDSTRDTEFSEGLVQLDGEDLGAAPASIADQMQHRSHLGAS